MNLIINSNCIINVISKIKNAKKEMDIDLVFVTWIDLIFVTRVIGIITNRLTGETILISEFISV